METAQDSKVPLVHTCTSCSSSTATYHKILVQCTPSGSSTEVLTLAVRMKSCEEVVVDNWSVCLPGWARSYTGNTCTGTSRLLGISRVKAIHHSCTGNTNRERSHMHRDLRIHDSFNTIPTHDCVSM